MDTKNSSWGNPSSSCRIYTGLWWILTMSNVTELDVVFLVEMDFLFCNIPLYWTCLRRKLSKTTVPKQSLTYAPLFISVVSWAGLDPNSRLILQNVLSSAKVCDDTCNPFQHTASSLSQLKWNSTEYWIKMTSQSLKSLLCFSFLS